MDTAQWPQGIGLEKTMEENNEAARLASEKRARPQEQLNCPRCNSTNTKFCYYNNYSLTQPRYFCKTCRRYWTEGGTLRNVPVGGGSRKNKKSSSSSSAAAAASSSSSSLSAISKTNMVIPDLNPPSMSLMMTSHFSSHQNPRMMIHEAAGQDLNLAFSAANNVEQHYNGNNNNNGSTTSALELLRTSYIPNSMQDSNNNNNNNNAVLYSSSSPGFSLLQEFKPSQLGFCVDGLGGSSSARYGDHPQENGSRLLFPFGDLKQTTTSAGRHHHELDHQNNKGQGNPSGYWNGLMGGGAAGSW